MESEIIGKPAFAYINVMLAPGESLVAQPDAMSSMDADLDLKARLNGGFFGGLLRKYLGGESLFINHFTNNTGGARRITLVQKTPGDIDCVDLNGDTIYFQPGAYLCSTPGVQLSLKWAGIASFIGGEGLFKLKLSGTGRVWYGCYGALLEKDVDGEFIVDSSHLVAYRDGIRLKVQLSGGIFSSFFSGEGLVTRVEGKGRIVIQTRSISGLAKWINRFL
jgi:uncharacterized protein (TIGR00266 family)